LPDQAQLAAVVEDLAPGLWSVVQQHRPAIYRWPPQLSTQGFTHVFFNNAQLPGERGKGSVWCAAAGRFDAGEHQLLAGVICVSEKPNSLSQVAVTQIGQWLEVLRVKG
jgi:hypothetical protein